MAAQYRKDSNGTVHLGGSSWVDGDYGVAVWKMPAGNRPATELTFAVPIETEGFDYTAIRVEVDGDISALVTYGGTVYLDGVYWQAA